MIFEDNRWKQYVEALDNHDTQANVKDLLAVDKLQVQFFLDYDRIAMQPGSLEYGEW